MEKRPERFPRAITIGTPPAVANPTYSINIRLAKREAKCAVCKKTLMHGDLQASTEGPYRTIERKWILRTFFFCLRISCVTKLPRNSYITPFCQTTMSFHYDPRLTEEQKRRAMVMWHLKKRVGRQCNGVSCIISSTTNPRVFYHLYFLFRFRLWKLCFPMFHTKKINKRSSWTLLLITDGSRGQNVRCMARCCSLLSNPTVLLRGTSASVSASDHLCKIFFLIGVECFTNKGALTWMLSRLQRRTNLLKHFLPLPPFNFAEMSPDCTDSALAILKCGLVQLLLTATLVDLMPTLLYLPRVTSLLH